MKSKKVNIDFYGKYKEGLTDEEIREYLLARLNEVNTSNTLESCPDVLIEKFNRVAGVNTMAFVDGHSLMYRWDVQRFTDCIFEGKATYFD